LTFGGGGLPAVAAPDEIIAGIRAAFAGVPRGAVTIHEAEVIDSYGSDQERAAARRLDTDASWDGVPDADIEECTTALCHLDPEGWRYYVPAYMVWSLRHYRVSSSVVSDFTIYTFDPSGSDPGLREYKLERFRPLDADQSRAVCRFLRHMAANDDYADGRVAEIALEEYWGRFCEGQDAEPLGAPDTGRDIG
jgi:Family of unknown function (DUF6714)